ncbi:PorT family protein [Cellulophaga sp. HaHaR_3_176]|uniref:porin family protein n=1 Tax=Cellulophaga sp. HaHaR_3_176 TaxID=1942464 RepID=UPI001C1F3064|nr:porin family protein [Cellulophaga sp. HaHaR_3_176]QWX84033.1 PorT family protein [Cellulophaga sp. HaHaR_3_176]
MFKKLFIILLLFPFWVLSQNVDDTVDHKYLEDQIYLGVNYNFMNNLPNDADQRNFSYGLNAGIIKDIPLNYTRNLGLGIGLGYAVNSYYSNLIATEGANGISYNVAESDLDFNRSKFEIHSVEVPFEIRWRNSSPTDYKFLRVYTGIKFAYNFSSRSKLITDTESSGFYNSDIKKFEYGLTLNAGYNTFNLHVYYSLTDFFNTKKTLTTGEVLNITPIKVGLVFYIL